MAVLETTKRLKAFHKEWISDSNPVLDFHDVAETLENAIDILERYEFILGYKTYAEAVSKALQSISTSKITFFKCPYNEFSCIHVNTCEMTVDKSCQECEHYNNGVRATGMMPITEGLYNFRKRTFIEIRK